MLEIDMEYLRHKLTKDEVPGLMELITSFVGRAQVFTKSVKKVIREGHDFPPHVWMDEPFSYGSMRDSTQYLLERSDISDEQKSTLEDIAHFWSDEKEIIMDYFYGQKYLRERP